MAPKRSLILQESDSTTSAHAEKELHTSSSEAAGVYELKKRRTPVSSPILSLKAKDRSSPSQKELSAKKDKKTNKSSKKDKTNVAKEKKRSAPQRCTILAFVELVNQYRQHIPDQTWEILNGTAFGSMMQCFRNSKVRESDCKKTEIDFEIIMRHFDKDRMLWVFGNLNLDLTPEFLTVLFHLPTTGQKIVPVTRIEDRKEQAAHLFPNCRETIGPSRTNIKELLSAELRNNKGVDPKRVASALLMYLFSTFFFSRTGINLTWDLVNICLDIEEVKKYDWATSIVDFLLSGLKKYNKDKPSVLNGCTLLVQYWFMESTKLVVPRSDAGLVNSPHFVVWNVRDMFNMKTLDTNPNYLEVNHE